MPVAATCRSRSQSAGRAGAVEHLPRGREVSRLSTSGQHRHARASKPCLYRRDYRLQSTVWGSATVEDAASLDAGAASDG